MSILNRLRTAYVQMPGPARRLISPALAMVPVRYRYGRTYAEYRDHIARAKTDVDFVARWQTERLRGVMRAAARTRHYSEVFRGLGLAKGDLDNFTVADLRQLPILTKDQLREDPTAFLSVPESQLDTVSTGGSSGRPLSFYLDKDRSAKEWAFVLDAWSSIGFKAGMKRALLRGIHIDNVDEQPWEFEPALDELRLSPFHLTAKWMDKYCDLIVENGIRYLHGYPSGLSILATHVMRRGRKDVSRQIDGVICASEQLHDHQRALLAQAYDTGNILSFYGLSEKVLFAVEQLGTGGRFAFEPLYGIVELVDPAGVPITEPGRKGHLVGTGLLLTGMPLIRYDTNDGAHLVAQAEPGNGYRAVMSKIAGRWTQEFLVGSGGELISMTAVNIHSPAYSTMQAFQFFQAEPGRVLLRVVLAPGRTLADVAPFIDEVSRKVGKSVTFDIIEVDRLVQSERGKIKFIDQKLVIGNPT